MQKTWFLTAMAGFLLLISACAPSTAPLDPFPTLEEPTPSSTDSSAPSPSVAETIPLPTLIVLIPQEEVDMIFEKIRSLLAEQLRVAPEAINLIEVSPAEWPDGCLGLASPDEMCIQVITPGYRLLIEVNGNPLEVRTDQNGNQVRINREILPNVRELDKEIPAGCHQEGMKTFVDFAYGYCFSYPNDFVADSRGLSAVYAQPENPTNREEVVARLDIFSTPLGSQTKLDQLVREFRNQFEGVNSPPNLRQTQISLGGQPAEVLEPVPGRLSARMVFVLHNGVYHQLIFFPINEPSNASDLARLYEAVISTFTFIP